MKNKKNKKNNISRMREVLHMSQCDLAKRAGVSQVEICRLENGERSGKPETLNKIYSAITALLGMGGKAMAIDAIPDKGIILTEDYLKYYPSVYK